MRLVDTSRHASGGLGGRVEVLVDGLWSSVCDDSWNNLSARVVCRNLGHGFQDGVGVERATYGRSRGPINLDDVICTGDEADLFSCRHSPIGEHNCYHGEDAGVICY